MAISLFGVTADSVRLHYFPAQAAFSTTSKPTAAIVLEKITAIAAELDAALRQEDIVPSDIANTALAAYQWCAETIRLGTALLCLEVMSGKAPDVAKVWAKRYEARLESLDEGGAAALGEGATFPTISADGPDDHIQEHSLDVGDDADISDVVPTLRRGDEL